MNVKKFLTENVKPATGCTEPVSAAYGVSAAYFALMGALPPDFSHASPLKHPEDIVKIEVVTDRNIFKNALSITIPGTNGEKGLGISAAMGVFLNPGKGLDLFSDVSKDIVKKAQSLIAEKKVVVRAESSEISVLNIKVGLTVLTAGEKKTAEVVIKGKHDRIVLISVDGETVFSDDGPEQKRSEENIPEKIESLLEMTRNIDETEVQFLIKGLDMNLETARIGLKGSYGLGLGRRLQFMSHHEILGKGVVTDVRIMAAAAGDARMGGAMAPVMSTAGSGNQGITALIPIAVLGNHYGLSPENKAKAALMSHLVTKYVGVYSGGLSALCGCAVKAGIGAAAGISLLLGGGALKIHNAINIMAADITGIICDGAKEGCALKLSTAAGAAVESAYLAMDGLFVSGKNGIVFENADETIRSIGKISASMKSTDESVMAVIESKNI